MVTQEKLLTHVLLRYRLGTFLIWLGVLTWLPFILLRATGGKTPFLYFLPFHLIGVVGGSRLRSAARKELNLPPPNRNTLTLAGHLMVFLGILAWVPYFYSKTVLGQPVEVMDFLPYHLTGVFGGVGLHLLNYLLGRYRKGEGAT